MAGFWPSFLLPGWGQAETGRPATGGLFVAWEGVTAMMTLKAQQETHYLKASGSTNLGAKRQEGQDWLHPGLLNHPFPGAAALGPPAPPGFPRVLGPPPL